MMVEPSEETWETKGATFSIPDNYHWIALSIILSHIIDDLFDNAAVFAPVADELYALFKTLSSPSEIEGSTIPRRNRDAYIYEWIQLVIPHMIYDRVKEIIKRLYEAYSTNEMPRMPETVDYINKGEKILEYLERIEIHLKLMDEYGDRLGTYKRTLVIMILSGLIQNIPDDNIIRKIQYYYLSDRPLETVRSETRTELERLFKNLIRLHLDQESLLSSLVSGTSTQVLLGYSSGLLEMFLVNGQEHVDFGTDIYTSLNFILGWVVYSQSAQRDITMNALQLPLDSAEDSYIFNLQLQSLLIVSQQEMHTILSRELSSGNINRYFGILFSIVLVSELLAYGAETIIPGFTFNNMPNNLMTFFRQYYYSMSEYIKNKYIGSENLNILREAANNIYRKISNGQTN
jgi:hypothetical protein